MSQQRAYTSYRGYRIYLPREGNFSTDAQGHLMIHAEFSAAATGDHECVAIAGCIATSYEQACHLSMEQAILIVDGKRASLHAIGQ
jgi:hypothetical protein